MDADGATDESVQAVVSCSDSSFLHPLPFNSEHDFHSSEFDLPDDLFADLDFDFSLDNIYLPFDTLGFHPNPCPEPPLLPSEFPESREFDLVCGSSDGRFSNDTKCSDLGDSPENLEWDASRVLKCLSDEADCRDRETPQPVSSADSRVLEVMNASSPGSCSSRDVPESLSSSHDLAVRSAGAVDVQVKSDDSARISVSKRKKECESRSPEPTRYTKVQRFDALGGASKPDPKNGKNEEEEEDKRKARLIRNRESAQLSRQRQKHYVEELEEKVKAMHFTIQDLSSKISYIMAENSNLRQQLCGNGMVRPATGVYPNPPAVPLGYPWFPFPPCIVKSKGSQVPLVPIPKLKSQQTATTSKSKQAQKRNTQIKTKKVTSVSFLGVLFFMLLFGVLVPIVKVKHLGVQDLVFDGINHGDSNGFYQQPRRILTLSDDTNGSNPNDDVEFSKGKYATNYNFSTWVYCNHLFSELELSSEQREGVSQACHSVVKSDIRENSTMSIAASLFVPRNDKLVKIDGNLVIHSVLASERATTSLKDSKVNMGETGLVVAGKVSTPFSISESGSTEAQPYVYRTPDEAHKALTSGSSGFKDASSATDGELQQWFHEGLAGPMLSSGMCTEVFHFDVSPPTSPASSSSSSSSVAIVIPPPSGSNQTAETPPPMYTSRNRRILQNLTAPPNTTEGGNNGGKRRGEVNQHRLPSSIVVSVLVDPRDAAGGGSARPIFVILLLDSVKYVTYSCMLPLKISPPHLSTSY